MLVKRLQMKRLYVLVMHQIIIPVMISTYALVGDGRLSNVNIAQSALVPPSLPFPRKLASCIYNNRYATVTDLLDTNFMKTC